MQASSREARYSHYKGNFADKGTALALIAAHNRRAHGQGRTRVDPLGYLDNRCHRNSHGRHPDTGSIVGKPASLAPIALKMDIKGALSLGFMTIFSFWFVDVFDTVGTLMGTASRAGMLDENGQLPRIKEMMTVDAIGTCLGAALGTSTITTYVESSAGIAEGGRTGLTAIVIGVLFLVSLVFAPLAGMIPSQATAPALIIVGVLMMLPVKEIEWSEFSEAFPAFMTIVMMPFAYSISDGISAGFISYVAVKLLTGKAKEIHWLVSILAAISVIHLVPGLF